MDLSKRKELTQEERLSLASDLHVMFLDELFRATRWKRDNAVFHGGTSLRIGWASQRFSEDLDFLVAKTAMIDLDKAAPKVVERVRLRISATLPGSVIAAKVRQKEASDGFPGMSVWDIRWSHPNRMGKVQVCLEFHPVEQAILSRYQARMTTPILGAGRVRITTPIPVPEMVSLWADKLKALATRPEFKFRDGYDLGFIAVNLERLPGQDVDDEMMREALERVRETYGLSEEDFIAGLKKALDSGCLEDYAAFRENMARWFDQSTWKDIEHSGALEDLLDRARLQAERGLEMLEARLSLQEGPRL